MFLEPHFRGQRNGWIEIVCGSMFSGKTEELIRRLKRAKIANQRVLVVKPEIDERFDKEKVISHDESAMDAVPIKNAAQLLEFADKYDVIGIDEAQFFDMPLVEVSQNLALKGVRIIIAGLDLDYKGVPFGPMPHLLAVAEYITKVHAICVHCGNLATHSYRKISNDAQIMIGEKNEYEPRCRTCYDMGNILDLH